MQGEGYVSAYQISSTPFVTSSTVAQGSTVEIPFGYISKFIVVRNTSAAGTLAVAFTANGLKPSNSNFFILSGSESFSADLRSDRLFLSGAGGGTTSFSLVCGLTTIPSSMLTPISASSGFPGVG
jgi:hypothetical protein